MDEKKAIILVVEDEDLLLRAINDKLEKSGLASVSCASGQQALDYLNNTPKSPDAIWLDYHLKDMNGLEFMNQVKENEKWSSIPVVVVSNSASTEKVHNMLACGAQKYILKAEHKLSEIVDTVKELIESENK